MDRQSLEQGIVRYGTPSYFFDMDLLRRIFRHSERSWERGRVFVLP